MSVVQFITFTYLACNTVRVFSYVPQIIAVGKEKTSVKAISLFTWGFWTLANLTQALYATFVQPDYLLSLMSYGNTLGCATVIGIVLYKRVKYVKPVVSQISEVLEGEFDLAPFIAKNSSANYEI